MKRFYLVLVMLALVFGAFVPAALAQGTVPPPAADPSAILLMTVGALLQWVVTYGIAWFVGWLFGFFPQLGDGTKKTLGGLLIAVLAAAAVYFVGFLTPAQLNLTVLQAALAIISAVVAWVGQLRGSFSGQIAFIQVNEARGRVAQIRMGK